MENKKFKINITDVALIVLSVVYLILLFTVFTPCGPKDDGSFMKCQWTWRAVVALSVNTVFLSLVHLLIKNSGVKIGLSIAAFGIAVTSALIPYKIIGLCMMDTMRCHTHTKAGVYVFSILIAVFALIDIVVGINKLRKK